MADLPFHVRHPVRVRFKDIDVGGHAHHSHALVYFEEARAAYWARVTGKGGLDGVDYILAEVSVRYHARVRWPGTVEVGVPVLRLGSKHFEMAYEGRDPETGELLLSGHTVQIMYDYERGSTAGIPPDTRRAIEELDGPFGRGGRPEGPGG